MQGGWPALAYTIKSKNQNYFLKVFNKNKYTSQNWIKNIDYYIPIFLWLHTNIQLKEMIVIPIFTNNGSYKFENEDYVFILYTNINRTTLAKSKLTLAQAKDLAKIVAELLLHEQDIPDSMLWISVLEKKMYLKPAWELGL